jgi:hypothetical protein
MTQDVKIGRQFHATANVTVGDSVGVATAIDLRNFAGGAIVPAGTITGTHTLSFYVAATADGTYRQLYDGASTPAAITKKTATGQAIKLPDELFGAGFLKVVSGTAAFTAEVSLKG